MAVAMSHYGYDVLVITGKHSELLDRLKSSTIGLFSIRISNFSFLNPLKIFKIFRVLKQKKIECIIINLSEDVKIAGLSAKLAGVKNIIYRRGSAIPIKNSLSNRFIFKKLITGIIANSEQTKRTILQNNARLFPEQKIAVIYNGIPIEKTDNSKCNALYIKQAGEVVLGNAGRLVAQKGQKYLIEIAEILKKRNLKFKLLIAGEGKLLDSLKRKAVEAGVQNNIVFLGFIKDIGAFMKSIDIFILTSLWEGFGYVLVEAMAAAKPVIAFDISSNPEIIKNNETGFLIKDQEIAAFADKVEILMENDSLRENMGIAGRRRAENLFDIEKSYRRFIEFIENDLNQ